jgi:hypothetical protein
MWHGQSDSFDVARDTPMRSLLLAAAIAALYALHQDIWFWRTAHPLVFGFLPVALAYHAAYCLAASVLMWALTKLAWPRHLEGEPRR